MIADVGGISSSCDETACGASQHELEDEERKGGVKKGNNQDEELTSLSWLQNTNLLQSKCNPNPSRNFL